MDVAVRQNNATGKSLLIYGNLVKPQNKKYFAFTERAKQGILIAIPSRQEGRRPSSRTWDGERWTLAVPITNGMRAYGKDVWSLTPRCWRQALA
jgi:hypothetical protein